MPSSQSNVTTNTAFLQPRGYEQLSLNDNNADALTPPPGATLAEIQAEDEDIRYRDDGNDPTKNEGQIIYKEQTIEYNVKDLTLIRLIATDGNAQKVNVTYYSYADDEEIAG